MWCDIAKSHGDVCDINTITKNCIKMKFKKIINKIFTWLLLTEKPRPGGLALAFQECKPGQSRHEAVKMARLGPAYLGPAWPGSRPQAGPCTALVALTVFYGRGECRYQPRWCCWYWITGNLTSWKVVDKMFDTGWIAKSTYCWIPQCLWAFGIQRGRCVSTDDH